MIEMNKTYDWDYIDNTYPDMWALVTNVKYKDGYVDKVKLLDLVTEQGKTAAIKKCRATGVRFQCIRTAYTEPLIGYCPLSELLRGLK